MTAPDFLQIETPDALASAVERWRGVTELGIDTEFVFESTYWPRPGLVQIAAAGEIALVDAVTVADLTPLAGPLLASETRKLVHAGAGDAQILELTIGVRPVPVFDTQVGAAFCGLGISLSYDALVRLLFGIEVGKHETRSDWTRRPLSREQLRYAAQDVVHLAPLAAELRERLAALGRLAWADEDSKAAVAANPGSDDADRAWLRVRGVERLSPRGRARAQALARWRDTEARRLDLPKTFLLRDETLLELAWRPPTDPSALSRLRGFDARRHAPFADAILAALAATADAEIGPEDGGVPALAPPRQLDRGVAAVVEVIAHDLALPQELLLSRRARARLLGSGSRDEAPSCRLSGWRREVLGREIDGVVGR